MKRDTFATDLTLARHEAEMKSLDPRLKVPVMVDEEVRVVDPTTGGDTSEIPNCDLNEARRLLNEAHAKSNQKGVRNRITLALQEMEDC